MKKLFLIAFTLLSFLELKAQNLNYFKGSEGELYAETKQVNQFIRRFNNEEDLSGKKFAPDSPEYRDNTRRSGYVRILFDGKDPNLTTEIKEKFIKDVTKADNPQFLEFRGKDWYAEVTAHFYYKGREEEGKIFLALEQENMGFKWSLVGAHFDFFDEMFPAKHDSTNGSFLHPMSHEIDFMNLKKALKNDESLLDYTRKDFYPDQLTLMFYEIEKGNLTFETISKVYFHFFQVDGWYFKISEFNRSGYNSGWLISSISEVENKDKEVLKRYILRQD
ncbi:hypothetical protein [Sediminitomix flava]|uniref:YARHG domain-containing protein n=1 Tax=Sediminitomix flava TaxID=379075 RepID=A0A315Z7G9_SEDFL|nr:hypothetical protein [Sediminitomix flava]PWJ40182.1 hypothetical protein BC781_105250 [Sediminitomix flava]